MRLEGVSKSYVRRGRSVDVLKDATVEIAPGEFVAIVGASGSGKSTVLLMLGGMLSPTSGTVLLEGRSLYELTPDQRAAMRLAHIGFLFQTFNLVPYLTALENVEIPLYLAGIAPAVQRTKATALLERVGLGDRLDHKPSELSVGQQQRVAVARVLANDSRYILADEPTGSLDPATAADIMGLLRSLAREGRSVLMVTHDPRAASAADRVLRIDAGAICEVGANRDAV